MWYVPVLNIIWAVRGRFCYARCLLTGCTQDRGDQVRHKTTNALLNFIFFFCSDSGFMIIYSSSWMQIVGSSCNNNKNNHLFTALLPLFHGMLHVYGTQCWKNRTMLFSRRVSGRLSGFCPPLLMKAVVLRTNDWVTWVFQTNGN